VHLSGDCARRASLPTLEDWLRIYIPLLSHYEKWLLILP
jgi:hypothetical protein